MLTTVGRGVLALALLAAPLMLGKQAPGDEPRWRFTVARPSLGLTFEAPSGGVDVTGDGVHDAVVTVRREYETESPEDPVLHVVSGAPRDSWVADVADAELRVRGFAAADGRPAPLGCGSRVVEDVNGDGIGELLVSTCASFSTVVVPRVFVVFGSAAGGEVRLSALGGAGFEVDLSPLAADDQLGAVVALADVDGRGSPGLAALLLPSSGSEPEEGQVRVYRLSGSGAQLWAVFEGRVADVRSAGDFHADGGSELLLSDYDEEGVSVLAVRLPAGADRAPRRLSELGTGEATRLRRYGRSQGDSVEPGGLLPRVEFNGLGDINADEHDDVIIGTASGGATSCDYCTGRSVIMGGPDPDSGPRPEFTVDGGVFGSGFPPVAAGDVNGDAVDDVLLHRYSGGFYLLHGSTTVEPVDLDEGGSRVTLVDSPLFREQFIALAPIGGGPNGGPVRVAVGSEQGLLVFEPPQVPPRDGVAFDGDPATVRRVDGDPVEVSEATVAGEAEAVARSLAVSRRSFAGSQADHVVVASAAGFADALAASPLLGAGPLLLTPRDVLPAAVYDEIDRVLPLGATVYVMGGEAAVSEAVAEELLDDCPDFAPECFRVRRLAGATRVETSAAVARLVGAAAGEVAVARAYGTVDGSGADVTGAGWADAVTAGGWAAATGTPVLLTPSGEGLHPAVADAVAELGVSSTVVLGGTAAVSDAAAAQLPGVRRVAGRDRSETAVAVAEQLWPAGTTRRVLVDGYREDGWTAGLPAAALAADGDAPLLLSQGETLPPATAAALRSCPDVLLLGPAPGDPDLLPDAVRAAQGRDCSS